MRFLHLVTIHDSSVQVPNFGCDCCGSRFYSNLDYPDCECGAPHGSVRRIQPVERPGPRIVPLDFPVPMPAGASFAMPIAA